MLLVAMVTSIVGGTMIQEVIGKPDLMQAVSDGKLTLALGIAQELINTLAVIGIFTALLKPLRQQAPKLAVAYVGVRIFEAIACFAAAIIPIMLMGMVNNSDIAPAENLIAMRDLMVNWVVTIFFGAGALILYIMLYRSRLVPRYISVWGIIATIGIVLTMFVPLVAIHPVLGLPIILNEIYLGIYLIVKGFRSTESKEEDSS